MSFTAVLVDQARVKGRVPTGRVVEGTPIHGEVTGPWFKARIFPDEYAEGSGQGAGRRVLVKGPHVICGMDDLEGGKIDLGTITPEKRLEIVSADVGNGEWTVTSYPQLLRKRAGVIGFYFTVRRLEGGQ